MKKIIYLQEKQIKKISFLYIFFLRFLFCLNYNYFLYHTHIVVFFLSLSTPESWGGHSNRVVTRSQSERARSAQIRLDADNLINAVNNEIWNHWNDTNAALSRRATEMLEAKNKAQMHLHRVRSGLQIYLRLFIIF